MNNEYMTVAQVAKTLNVEPRSVQRAIKTLFPNKKTREREAVWLTENEVTLLSEHFHASQQAPDVNKEAVTQKEALLKFAEALEMLAKANGCDARVADRNLPDLRNYVLNLTSIQAHHLSTTLAKTITAKHTPERFRAAIAFADMFDRIHDTENHAIKAQRELEDD